MVLAVNRETHFPPAATVFMVEDEEDLRWSVSLLVRSVCLADESPASARDFRDRFDAAKPCNLRMLRMSTNRSRSARRCSAIVEREARAVLVRGDSSKQLVHSLSIHPKTIGNHWARIREKKQVDNHLAHLAASLPCRNHCTCCPSSGPVPTRA
ncbi:MAG TPA: hypothetical protein VG826_02095 [Pirellulales bacterium]|nr:hypothetical protein [Pirellulales bacterium]